MMEMSTRNKKILGCGVALALGFLILLLTVLIEHDPSPAHSIRLDVNQTKDAYGNPCYNSKPCKIAFGEDCFHSDDCIGNLLCVGIGDSHPEKGKCQCERPEHQKYHPAPIYYCVGMTGSPCIPNEEDENLCVERSQCVSVDDQTHRCECKEGYIFNQDRECDIAYSHSCDSHVPCDTIAELVCVKTYCACPHAEKVFEPERRKCSIPVGISCFSDYECVEYAQCQKPEKLSTLTGNFTGRCKCRSGYEVDHADTRMCQNELAVTVYHTVG